MLRDVDIANKLSTSNFERRESLRNTVSQEETLG
jgi:hypothetical protein